MLLRVVSQIRVKLPEGIKDCRPGDILDLPDDAAQNLLRLAGSGRLKVLAPCAFSVGDPVWFLVIRHPGQAMADWFEGVILEIDEDRHLALVAPSDSTLPPRFVSLERVNGRHLGTEFIY